MYRLLIVDDDKDICETIMHLVSFKDYGFDPVLTAASYPEAVDLAALFHPHVILVDIDLEKVWGGCDLVEHLHNLDLKTIFCMIADSDDPRSLHRSMQAGASDYLVKPLEPTRLQEFLQQTVRRYLKGITTEVTFVQRENDPVLHIPHDGLSLITIKILQAVRAEYQGPLTLTAIAERFQMNSTYIGRIFLKETGMKFTDYLMAYRMGRAKRLLCSSKEKISTIANLVGYPHVNHFYTHFKTFFGISPSVMRSTDNDCSTGGS